MIVRLALALGLLLSGLLLYETVWASAWHTDGACFGQSWDNKTGPDQIWWKSVTACNDHPAGMLNFNLHLQKFDWNSWTWGVSDAHQLYGQDARDAAFTAASRYWTIYPGGPGYEGMACYRIRAAHFVVEWEKGGVNDPLVEDHSVSWGECY